MKQAIFLLNHFAFIKEYGLDDKAIKEFTKIALNLFVFKAKCNFSYKEYGNICTYKYKKIMASIAPADGMDVKENMKYEKCLDQILEFESLNKDQLEFVIYSFMDTNIIDKDKLKCLLKENTKDVHYYAIKEQITSLINKYLYSFKTKDNELSKKIIEIIYIICILINHLDITSKIIIKVNLEKI